jgi:hypothetical protein
MDTLYFWLHLNQKLKYRLLMATLYTGFHIVLPVRDTAKRIFSFMKRATSLFLDVCLRTKPQGIHNEGKTLVVMATWRFATSTKKNISRNFRHVYNLSGPMCRKKDSLIFVHVKQNSRSTLRTSIFCNKRKQLQTISSKATVTQKTTLHSATSSVPDQE